MVLDPLPKKQRSVLCLVSFRLLQIASLSLYRDFANRMKWEPAFNLICERVSSMFDALLSGHVDADFFTY